MTSFQGPLRLGAGVLEDSPSATLMGEVVHSCENASASPPFTLGYRLVPKRDVWLTHLRHYFGVRITLWDESQKLVEKSIGGPPGAWAETPLDGPLLLQRGRIYTIGLYTGQGAYLGNGQYYARTWYAKHNAVFSPADVEIDAKVFGAGDTRPTTASDAWEQPLVDIRYVMPSVEADSAAPASVGSLAEGVGGGKVAVNLPGRQVFLLAQDEEGIGGCSDPFPVFVRNDLVLSAVSDKPHLTVGQRGTLTLTVTNVGPGEATGVVVTNRLPAGAGVLSVEATQ